MCREARCSHTPQRDWTNGRESREIDQALKAQRTTVRSFVARRTRTLDDCDDITQDVLIYAAGRFHTRPSAYPLDRWLLRIAAGRVKNYYRDVAPRYARFVSLDAEPDSGPGYPEPVAGDTVCPFACTTRKLLSERIRAAIVKACTPLERDVLDRLAQGDAPSEMEGRIGAKSATIRSHLLRGRAKVLSYLVRNELDALGGSEALEQAEKKAMAAPDPHLRLKDTERKALHDPRGRAAAFRTACVKIARFLPLAALLPGY